MNVLLIGGPGKLMNALIGKLRKEGHRIFLLTGSHFKQDGYESVFETYSFPYNSDCMNEIFESVRPDVTVYLGAFDSNFAWLDAHRDLVRFHAGLCNLLSAYSTGEYGRFLYLSSSDVWSGDFSSDLTENTKANATSGKGMALAQGEDLCESYRIGRQLDVVILRLDHLYTMPDRRGEVDGICANLCLSALLDGRMRVNSGHRFSMIYLPDAVAYIYKMIETKQHRYPVYNLGSGEELSELTLAHLILQKREIQIEEVNDYTAREVVSPARFTEEFGMRIFHPAAEVAPRMMAHMIEHREAFLYLETEREPFWSRVRQRMGWLMRLLVPFIESAVCFVPFLYLSHLAEGSRYFQSLDLLLLYVLLFAIIHGQQAAIFSGVLALAGKIILQMASRTGLEVLMDYGTYIWAAQLFILGLVVGYLRDTMRSMKEEEEQQEEWLNYRLKDMTDINHSNVRVKDALETQIINQNDSIGEIYNITSRLERYLPEEVLFYAAEVIATLMNSKDVAIYSVSNADFARLASSTSRQARSFGHSIRYREMHELSTALQERRVYINRTMDEAYPAMANAIYEKEQMELIVMVWGIPWEQMTLAQANILTVTSYLIQNAVLHADRYMAALQDRRYADGQHVMETESFTTLVHAFYTAMERELTECCLLCVDVEPAQYRTAGEILSRKLRTSDYLGTLSDGKLYALLANTDRQDAQIVIRRFRECGYESTLVEGAVS